MYSVTRTELLADKKQTSQVISQHDTFPQAKTSVAVQQVLDHYEQSEHTRYTITTPDGTRVTLKAKKQKV